MGISPCVACARVHFRPETPWVPFEQEALLLQEHRADLLRELELARAWIVPSRSHGQRLAGLLGRDGQSAPLAIVPPVIEQLPARLASPEPAGAQRPFELASFAHLAPHKGAHLAIEALRRIVREQPAILHLFGDEVEPAYAARLRELADGLDVRFHGAYRVDELDRLPALAGVHMQLSTSLGHESYGMTLDEGLALGLPACLPDSGAFAERAAGVPWALVYPAGSAPELARTLLEVARDPDRWRGLRAAVPARAELSRTAASVAQATVAVYEQALERGAPAVSEPGWYEERMELFREQEWDRMLCEHRARQAEEGQA
jgi:glycosyltransferase involved in cell wall biosynthesis